MKFEKTPIDGLVLVHQTISTDERGYFSRTFCEREFEEAGLHSRYPTCGRTFNHKAGLIRGLHYQQAPHGEAKLVRCTRGRIFDVVVDLRPDSRTFRRHFAVELGEQEGTALYIPKGFAHGLQTLVDSTEVFYHLSDVYVPESATGIRWDDPALGIVWPIRPPHLADRDRSWKPLAEAAPAV